MKKILEQYVSRKYGALTSELFIRGFSQPKKVEKIFFIPGLFILSGVILDRWYYSKDFKALGESLLEKDLREINHLDRFFSNTYKLGEELIKKSIDIKNENLADLSLEELVDILKKFTDFYETFSVTLAGFCLQIPIEEKLRELLKRRIDIGEDLAVLSSPCKKNIVNEEQEALLKITVEFRKDNISAKSVSGLPKKYRVRLKRHIEKFGWMTRGGLDDAWTEEDVFTRLKEVAKEDCGKKLITLEKNRRMLKQKSEKILRQIKADKPARRLVKIAKELVYFRTFRTDYLNLAMFNIRPLLAEIGKRKGYTFREIAQFRLNEILSNRLVRKSELTKRLKNFIIFSKSPNKIIFSSNQEKIDKYESKYFEEDKIGNHEVKGNVAFRGKVRGKVVIIWDKSDLGKSKKGCILVAAMTTPDFIGAMEKAAAFITDEGGITCHAAIIAREMKKPCIIGTRIATKVLKDGDLVEVDANKGTVKIVSIN